ncbi:hypothetical protein Tco_1277392 [Tanacetum coccineum]
MLYVVNSVLTSGVDMVLEKDFADFALQEMEIHPLMLLIRTLSMNLQTFSPTLHNPSTDHTLVNYVETTLIMVMIVLYGCRFFDQPPQNSIDHQPQSILEDLNQQRMNDVHHKWDDMIESKNELLQSLGEMLRQREQEANLSTHTLEPSRHFNFIYYHDDGDDARKNFGNESITMPLSEIISQLPPSIVITTSFPILPIEDPKDSLIMGNEELSTIPEKKSDEFIKSSVEDIVPILSESEDTSGSDSECDLPSCDDFSPINIPERKSVTFSNPLFDSNKDFTSSDNESLSDEDVPEDKVKIYLNPLFEFDDEYISSNVNPLFDEVLENIESKDSYVSNLDEPTLLVTPLSDANEDECFDPGGEINEIDAFLDMDISTDFEDDYYDSEGDIIYLESLLIKILF